MHDLMTTKRQREIVIEFEKIQLIRKRARTRLEYCEGCGTEADLIEMRVAAELFDTNITDLTEFVVKNSVHYSKEGAAIVICIPSLLATMHEKQIGTETRLIDQTCAQRPDR